MIGHVIFNAQDSFVKKREERRKSARQNSLVGGDGVAGMGSTSYGSTNHSTYQHSASMPVSGSTHSTEVELENGNGLVKKPSHLRDSSSESTKLRGAVSDGATPCCQYTL